MSRSTTAQIWALLGCLIGFAAPASADPFFKHVGDVDPALEGWTPGAVGTGTSAGPVDDGGTKAWRVTDGSTASGSTLTYQQVPSAAQISAAGTKGWVLRAFLRVVNPAGTTDTPDFSVFAEYANGTQRYNLRFGVGPNGTNPSVRVGDRGHVVPDAIGTYHLYELAFDPNSGSATLYVDGTATALTGYVGEAAGTAGTRVIWGSGQSNSTGEAHYALVEWGTPRDTDQDEIPNYRDNCPFVQNNPNTDAGGVGAGSGPDGIGDDCQCGDLNGDFLVDASDAEALRAYLADPANVVLTPGAAALCNILGGTAGCDILDVVALLRRASEALPLLLPICGSGTGFGLSCGDGICTDLLETCTHSGSGACQLDCGHCSNGAPCSLAEDCQSRFCDSASGLCASDPSSAPGTCGDGTCDPGEGCTANPPGCQPDCGECPSCARSSICGPAQQCGVDADCREPLDPDLNTRCREMGRCGGLANGVLCESSSDCSCGNPAVPCNDLQDVFLDSCDFDVEEKFCTVERQTCFTNADCEAPSVCELSVTNPPGGCESELSPLGALCTQSEQCESGICNVGFCSAGLLSDGAVCTTNSACESGLCVGVCLVRTCGDGNCTAPAETCYSSGPTSCQADCEACSNDTPCLNNADCGSGICNFGFCIGSCQAPAVPCTTDAACCSGSCNGVCDAACGDGTCNSPFELCGQGAGTIAPAICEADCGLCPDGALCLDSNDCAGGICNFGFCISECQAAGIPCTIDAACCTGACAGLCLAVCPDGNCEEPFEFCGTGNSDPVCEADCGKCGNGTPCLSSAACASGICNFGVCIGACQPAGVPCTIDAACCTGACAGVCLAVCPDGNCEEPFEFCGTGNSDPVCEADCGKCPDGTPCTSSAACEGGICNFGFCISECQAAGVPCTIDAACCTGACAGVCLAVCPDGNCEGPFELCGSGNSDPVCEGDCGKCGTNTPCLSNATCASGICNFGFCISSCQGPGALCSTGAACCSGTCPAGLCPIVCGDGTCSPPVEVCGNSNSGLECNRDCGKCGTGSVCLSNADCSSGICNFGICISGCLGNRSLCSTGAACCSAPCTAGLCCKSVGASCSSGSECCSGGCVNLGYGKSCVL